MKTTPWFPGDVKPVRVGVYERRGQSRNRLFSNWNGVAWGILAVCPFTAARLGERIRSNYQRLKWRGLTEPTEKK